MSAQIDVSGVHRTYRRGRVRVPALRGVTFTVPPGRLVALKGRSGAGKSTLLNLLAGLDRPDEGRIVIGDQDVTASGDDDLVRLRRETVSVVYQSFALLPLLTAEENVGLPLRIAKVGRDQREQRVARLLQRVGLSSHAKQRPTELSGGQMQRVAIARALAIEPAVLLADEPTAQLDSQTGTVIMELLHQLVQERGMTALVATHDPLVEQRADGVLHLEDGRVSEATPAAV